MAAAANRGNPSIEFIVKPNETLYLEGGLRRLPRVNKGEQYPCQMQKTQQFSCLFRHYAKHNGLRKEDLVFTFVDELLPDQTPESVHLMPQDEIRVDHRRVLLEEQEEAAPAAPFFADTFRCLLRDGMHSDIEFKLVDPNVSVDEHYKPVIVRAHKAILAARSKYFDNMFKPGGMSESTQTAVEIIDDEDSFRRMLEFLYTNTIENLDNLEASDVYHLLSMASRYLLDSLWELVEKQCARVLSIENLASFIKLSSQCKEDSWLRAECIDFAYEHRSALLADRSFRSDLEQDTSLGLFMLELATRDSTDGGVTSSSSKDRSKRRRLNSRPIAGGGADRNEIEHAADAAGAANTISSAPLGDGMQS